MTLRRKRPEPDPPAAPVGEHVDKLSHVRPIFHDEDERQSTADRSTYHNPLQTLYEPVPLPRWLKPRKSKKRF
jgi:hypothetical protein